MRIVQIDLLQMSIAAGILIIGIVIFRSLFVHRIPKKVMIILWGIAILRLARDNCIYQEATSAKKKNPLSEACHPPSNEI